MEVVWNVALFGMSTAFFPCEMSHRISIHTSPRSKIAERTGISDLIVMVAYLSDDMRDCWVLSYNIRPLNV